MTDQFIVTDAGEDYLRFQRAALARERREAEVRPGNKAAVFDALAGAGVLFVEVGFDGAGDSGQIESLTARSLEGAALLPADMIEQRQASWPGPDVEIVTMSVPDAIEALAYDLLRTSHAGWEINEGAYGEFTFDVAARTIRLAYNERVLETEFSEHEF